MSTEEIGAAIVSFVKQQPGCTRASLVSHVVALTGLKPIPAGEYIGVVQANNLIRETRKRQLGNSFVIQYYPV